MKNNQHLIFSLLLLFCFGNSTSYAQYVNIPDANFRTYLQQNFASCMNGNGQLDTTCTSVTSITGINVSFKNIADLTGIQYFDALTVLYCSNNLLTNLPALPANLKEFYCNDNDLIALNNLPTGLLYLDANRNNIASIASLPSTIYYLKIEQNQLTSLPALPSSLIFLYCGYNQLTAIPTLPSVLKHLSCEFNALTNLPTLPNDLYKLAFYGNQIPSSALPAVLPNGLVQFHSDLNPLTQFPDFSNCPNIEIIAIASTQIPSIPPLPSTLKDFRCNNNTLISSLPTLPSGLEILECQYCNISILPPLPNTLKALQCGDNPIINFPTVLPDSIYSLSCNNLNLSSLPALTPQMYLLSCLGNPGLTCLPILRSKLEYLDCTGTGVTCLPNQPLSLLTLYPANLPVCGAASPCALYPTVTGKVFLDSNNNGVQDMGEISLSQKIISAQPGNWFAATDVNGNYELTVEDNIAYTQTTTSNTYFTLSPSSYSVNLPMSAVDPNNDFMLAPIATTNDLFVDVVSGVARPGFDMNYWITVKNQGTTTLNGNYQLTFDNSILSFVSSSQTLSGQTANTVAVSFSNLPPFSTQTWHLVFNVNANTPLGTPLTATAEVTPITGDATPADNVSIDTRNVQGAYDPNEKKVSQTSMTPTEVASGKWLKYVIFFQNTGTDTAFNVKLVDTLSQNLDIASFQTVNSSAPFNFTIADHGTLTFRFPNIQLPDSNINEPGSHGFVAYIIKPKNTLVLGNKIDNTAGIYFDYNVPIITNTITTTIELTNDIDNGFGSSFAIYPNPSNGTFVLTSHKLKAEDIHLQLLSITGVSLQTSLLSEQTSEDAITVRCKDVNPGMYFLEIQAKGKKVTQKIVIK